MVAQTGYLDVTGFALRSVMPAEAVARLEAKSPGWLQTALNDASDAVNALLAKRYAVPFTAPYPSVVLRWVAKLVTLEGYAKLGFNPSSAEDKAAIVDQAVDARKEIAEAADAQNGKYELPLRQDTTVNGVVRGAPTSYSEQSPYVGRDRQATTGRLEDYAAYGSR